MSTVQYLLLTSLLFPLLFLILFRKRKQQSNHLPRSPFKLPIIGNLHQLGRLPHRSLHALSLKYSPLVLLKFGHAPTLLVSSADMARKIMKTHDLAFSSRPPVLMAEKLMYGKDIIFATYGEYWRQARRICVLHLLSSKQVELLRPVREEEMTLFIDRIRSSAATKGVVNLSECIISLTNSVTCRTALGKKYGVESGGGNDINGKELSRLMREFLDLFGAFHVADFFPQFGWISKFSGMDERVERNFKEWDHLLTRILKDHEKGQREDGDQISHEGVKDFVDALLQVQKDGSDGIFLTQDHIKALIMDMLIAGTVTTYTSLEWTMVELMRHPKAMEKLQEEVRGVACGQPMVTADNLHHMSYLKSVIKESLRMHPPLPLIPRESMKDVKIDGYHIPANTRVMINAWAIGRNPKSWESPEEFLPERFLSSGSYSHINFKGHDYELLPFGAGRRGCPGISFATVTIELMLANLVYHFDWEMPSGMSREDLDMTEYSRLVLHKKDVLLLVAKPHY